MMIVCEGKPSNVHKAGAVTAVHMRWLCYRFARQKPIVDIDALHGVGIVNSLGWRAD